MNLPLVLAFEAFREALQKLQDRDGGLVGERRHGRLVVAGVRDHDGLLSGDSHWSCTPTMAPR